MQTRRSSYQTAALAGALATAGLIGWLYAAHQIFYALPFAPFDITDLIIRLTPGAVATAGIERLGQWARISLRWAGVLTMIGCGAGVSAGYVVLRRRLTAWQASLALTGAALLATLLVRAPVVQGPVVEPPRPEVVAALTASYALWATVVVWAIARATPLSPAARPERLAIERPTATHRRAFLARFGAAMFGLAAGGFLVGRRRQPTPPIVDLPAPARPQAAIATSVPPPTAAPSAPTPLPATSLPRSPTAATGPQPTAAPPVLAQPILTPSAPLLNLTPTRGTRPNITPLPDFFEVNIGAEYPRIDLGKWRLAVKGLVERPLSLTFDDLLALPRVDIYGTLACISNEVGGRLIGTTLFSGARLADVLQMAGPGREVEEVVLRGADGYDESIPLNKALHEDTLLVYGMEGKILTPAHGYPLRIYNPNHYGMKGPKWLASLELIAQPHTGYWPRLGWDKEATVKTTSVIDGAGSIRAENSVATLGGIAFAGWRGIQEVGVQIDGGEFRPAILDRPLSPLTWVRWRYDWRNPPPGNHKLVVRAIDGNGEEQTPQPAPPHPDGASGWHRAVVTI